MSADYRVRLHAQLEAKSHALLAPVRFLVDLPSRLQHRLHDGFLSRTELVRENASLRARESILQAQIHQLTAASRENFQLRYLLGSTAKHGNGFIMGEVLAVASYPHQQKLIVDRGSNDGVYLGQPVLDGYGIVGQVVEKGPLTSTVMLVNDFNSAIPVETADHQLRSIASGDGASTRLHLRYVPDTVSIKPGDVLVSSGLGLRYPVGYPVGVVERVRHTADKFLDISVHPSAHLQSSRFLMLVWPQRSKWQREAGGYLHSLQELEKKISKTIS